MALFVNFRNPDIVHGLSDIGISNLSPFQFAVLRKLLYNQKHSLVVASPGMGKTIPYAIAALTKVDPALLYPQIICICATHEAAIQTGRIFRRMVGYTQGFTQIEIGHAVQGKRGKNDILFF